MGWIVVLLPVFSLAAVFYLAVRRMPTPRVYRRRRRP